MMLLPVPVTAEEFEYVVEAALSGDVITGPWNEALESAIDALATVQSEANELAARAELAQWVTEWNSSLPA